MAHQHIIGHSVPYTLCIKTIIHRYVAGEGVSSILMANTVKITKKNLSIYSRFEKQ